MFGYIARPMGDGRTILFATPEKAILDLLYLYPFYKSVRDMTELRFDDYFMSEELNRDLFLEYSSRIAKKELDRRVMLLLKTYSI